MIDTPGVRSFGLAHIAPSDVLLAFSDLAEAIEQQRSAWLGRARPGGLTDSLGHLEQTLAADQASGRG